VDLFLCSNALPDKKSTMMMVMVMVILNTFSSHNNNVQKQMNAGVYFRLQEQLPK